MIAITEVDLRLIALFKRAFLPFARVALFVVFFWFGILKVFGLSPASPLANEGWGEKVSEALKGLGVALP